MTRVNFAALHFTTCCIGGAFLLSVSTGCQTAQYYTQAIAGQWQLTTQKQAIPELIDREPHDSSLRRQLQLVEEIVVFAGDHLGLPAEGAYGTYVDLQRSHVVWNVLAAPEFSMQARTWWYPIVGNLKYRGYFKKEHALKNAERLKRKGEDVHVGGVTAYSTLGFFDDPVLNTFIDDPDVDLAELLFHELAHRRLFLSGDTDFNEAFATVVGREGVRRWLLAKGESIELKDYLQHRQRDDQVIELILSKRAELIALYQSDQERSVEKLRTEKAHIISSLRREYDQLKRLWPGYRGFEKFMTTPINNARLNGVDTYYELVPQFERLLADTNTADDQYKLTAFFDLVESTKRMSKEERRAFLSASRPIANSNRPHDSTESRSSGRKLRTVCE